MMCYVENYNISAILDKISNRLLGRRKKPIFQEPSWLVIVSLMVSLFSIPVLYGVKKPLASHKYGEENLIWIKHVTLTM